MLGEPSNGGATRPTPTRSPTNPVSAASLGALFFVFPARARAVDPFEIQVYDGTADAPGVPGLELHLNTVASGRTVADPTGTSPRASRHSIAASVQDRASIGDQPWAPTGRD